MCYRPAGITVWLSDLGQLWANRLGRKLAKMLEVVTRSSAKVGLCNLPGSRSALDPLRTSSRSVLQSPHGQGASYPRTLSALRRIAQACGSYEDRRP